MTGRAEPGAALPSRGVFYLLSFLQDRVCGPEYGDYLDGWTKLSNAELLDRFNEFLAKRGKKEISRPTYYRWKHEARELGRRSKKAPRVDVETGGAPRPGGATP